MQVGVLALQGNFALHEKRLFELGAKPFAVRTVPCLLKAQALVLPGGESTTFLRLLEPKLRQALVEALSQGLPTLATCAGLIVLAQSVSHPEQDSLKLLDVSVQRNAYGRQVDSFIDPTLAWTAEGVALLQKLPQGEVLSKKTVEGVFIRAPKITAVGANTQVLLARGLEPVMVRQNNILAATFHPELSLSAQVVHQLLLSGV